RKIAAYEDVRSNVPLMAEPPKPGTIVETKTIPEIGVTEWKLKNGARVIVKPTDFKNDEIRMAAFSPGGHSLAKDADFESAKFADDVIGESGLGPFDAVQLRKSLTGRIASVHTRISELDEGLGGYASIAD